MCLSYPCSYDLGEARNVALLALRTKDYVQKTPSDMIFSVLIGRETQTVDQIMLHFLKIILLFYDDDLGCDWSSLIQKHDSSTSGWDVSSHYHNRPLGFSNDLRLIPHTDTHRKRGGERLTSLRHEIPHWVTVCLAFTKPAQIDKWTDLPCRGNLL